MDGVGVAVLRVELTMSIRSGGQKFWLDGCVVLPVGMGLYASGLMLVVARGEGDLWVSAGMWGLLLSRGTLLDWYRALSVGMARILALLDGTSDSDWCGDSVSACFKLLHSPKIHSATPISGC